MNKHIVAAVLAVVVGVAIVGAYLYPGSTNTTIEQTIAGSPVGTNFANAKVAATNYTPSSSAASSTSILNTDASTRYVTDNFVDCNGVNGQGITIQAATTTVSSQGLQANTNLAMNTFGTTTTTATNFYTASSTAPNPAGVGLLWPSNTYLTFVATSSAFNSGVCTVGVHYLAS